MLLKTTLVLCLFAGVANCGYLWKQAESFNLLELVRYFNISGLLPYLEISGPFTLLAPTDSAFKSLPPAILDQLENNNTFRQHVMIFHLIRGHFFARDFHNERVYRTVYPQHDIRINIHNHPLFNGSWFNNTITANDAVIVHRDQPAVRGVLHIINSVLYKFPEYPVFGFLIMNKNVSTLLEAVRKASLMPFFDVGSRALTLFAPSDEAFAKLSNATLDTLLSNVTLLTEVLQYHVANRTIYSQGIQEVLDLPTIQGHSLHLTKECKLVFDIDRSCSGTIRVNNDVLVTDADIPVWNGVIHVIDSVLFPPNTLMQWDELHFVS